ncbi:MAG: ATP-binding protein [Candidatus Hadarchaeaceae archaeon]
MHTSVFLDRERELVLLKDRYRSDRAEFVVIYGRRRVGKTELIDQFIARCKNGVRLLAREESKTFQLSRFAAKLGEFFQDEFLKKTPFADWDGFFEYLSKKADKRTIIAIDEFPYLIKEDRALPSILQDYWDSKLKKSRIFLVLSGSSISMMESKVLGHRSPLYGRRTGQLLMKPFNFTPILHYVGDLGNAIEFYSVFGGTPAYIMEIDPRKNIFTNIAEKILREDSFIYKDVEFVLRQELVEPRYYFSILLSIARGNHRVGLIVNDTGLSKSIVNKYLSVLRNLQLVDHIVPITESHKSKKGLWFLSDNLFDFWFRFVNPYIDDIERGRSDLIINNYIKPHFNEYIGRHFESIVREFLEEMNAKSLLPSHFTKIGRWWHKDTEIDAVALNEQTKEILFVECKWRDKVDIEKVLHELKEKADFVDWRKKRRKEYYAIFAKSFRERIEEENVLLFDLKDLENV